MMAKKKLQPAYIESDLWPLCVPLDGINEDEDNANEHNSESVEAIAASLAKFKQRKPIVVNKRNKTIIAGNGTYRAALSLGWELIAVVFVDDDKKTATGFAIADNRTAQLSFWDVERLLSQLSTFEKPEDVPGMTSDFVAQLAASLGGEATPVVDSKQPSLRQLPLDLILTFDVLYDPPVFFAAKAGYMIGTRSAMRGSGKPHTSQLQPERWQYAFDLQFIDNNYHEYDHEKHLEAVARWQPKYATVRDLMTKQQCLRAGVPYYKPSQIIKWGEELAQYAEHVIFIPKYKCLHLLPPESVIGYSVPTTHGGTPLEPKYFAGRQIHLLGGSWKKQLNYLAAFGNQVVSIDNNYIHKQAMYGSFVYPDGSTGQLGETLNIWPNNPLYVAMVISLGNIAGKLNELHGREPQYQKDLREQKEQLEVSE